MQDQLDNPVIKDTTELESKFLEAAALADKGQDIPADLVPKGVEAESPTAPETPEKVDAGSNPDNSETEPEKKERPRDAQGRFTKTEDGKDIPEAERKLEPTKEQQPPSDYEAKKAERKQKEQERLEKTWENVNKRKEELEARQRELDAREQAQRQPQQQAQGQQQREFSARQLWEARNDFKARAKRALDNGDFDAFNENNALAEQAEQHANQFAQIEAQEAQQVQLQQLSDAWNAHFYKAVETHPDLKSTETPLRKEVDSIMSEHGKLLTIVPNGFQIAVDIAKLRLEAGSASELRDTNKKLQAEIDRLNGLTALGGSGPTAQPAKKKFEELSPAEQEQRLLEGARAIDESRN